MIWLLAAKHDNLIPYEMGWITKKIGSLRPGTIERLISLGWLIEVEDASGVLAVCKHDASTALVSRASAPSQEKEEEKEKEKYKKETPPPSRGQRGEPSVPRLSWSKGFIPPDVVEAIPTLPACENAKVLEHSTGHLLRSLGFNVNFHFRIPDRGDGRPGYIDIVACRGEEIIAVECDRLVERQKSIIKLEKFGQPSLIILRDVRRRSNGSVHLSARPAGLVLPEGYEVEKGANQ